ncbi:MAG: radical SAM protein [Candidatus Omnitrophota bacterium]|nr:radical SAM protein [Candidatus Omnitrophota bacterium]
MNLFTKNLPLLVLHPTHRCNARCLHCYNWERVDNSERENELSLEEIKLISRKLPNIEMLLVSGGEPSLREDLNLIVKEFYLKNRLRILALTTNGVDSQGIIRLAEEIMKTCPGLLVYMLVSLDDLGGRHDRIRNLNGCFEKAAETITGLKRISSSNPRLKVSILTTYSKYNEANIWDIHKFVASELGLYHQINLIKANPRMPEAKEVDLAKFCVISEKIEDSNFQLLMGNKLTYINILSFSLDYYTRKFIINAITDKTTFNFCKAGTKILTVISNGRVYPCEFSRESFGNLRDVDYDMGKLLASASSQSLIAKIKNKQCLCTAECYVRRSLILDFKMRARIHMKTLFLFNQLLAKKILNKLLHYHV